MESESQKSVTSSGSVAQVILHLSSGRKSFIHIHFDSRNLCSAHNTQCSDVFRLTKITFYVCDCVTFARLQQVDGTEKSRKKEKEEGEKRRRKKNTSSIY